RARDTAELAHRLRAAGRAGLARRDRQCRQLREALDRRDLRRRLAEVRVQLLAADRTLGTAVDRRYHRAEVALREAAGRLDMLSPLAVLSRGYAVCWNADRSAIIRDAAAVAPGDRVQVRVGRGALTCTVERTERESEG
ncbi:MAG: hypothetical protein KGN76_00415, partial [Acidobacteriota bacterium]|nr:hypothetical protein [Acidobacteriota bacterium]